MFNSSLGNALWSFSLASKVSHELIAGGIGLVALTGVGMWKMDGWWVVLPPTLAVLYWGARALMVSSRKDAART